MALKCRANVFPKKTDILLGVSTNINDTDTKIMLTDDYKTSSLYTAQSLYSKSDFLKWSNLFIIIKQQFCYLLFHFQSRSMHVFMYML